jgi:hypothetical protein
MIKRLDQIFEKPDEEKGALFPYVALTFLGYAFYNIALRFAPIDFDDLVILSSVKSVKNPLTFFFSDWGFGNYGYRPLHSVSLWLGYQIFGVSSGPNQLLNIILHIMVILLLYALLRQLLSSKHWGIAFILSCLGLISLYTVSPPTWVSDRPTLFVSLFLLIQLNHFAWLKDDEQPKLWLLCLLSVLALMSKESGLLVPLVGLYYLQFENKAKQGKMRSILVLVLVLAVYAVVRFVLFGANAAAYSESGYLLGRNYYENLGVLGGTARLGAYLENAIKNILAVFLPVFDGQGKLSLIGTRMNSLVVVGCTLLLTLLVIGKKPTKFQRISLVLILLNGLAHVQLFRYRTLYIAQLAFLIFIAASTALQGDKRLRKVAIFILGTIFVMWNMHMIGENLDFELTSRAAEISQASFEEDILATSNSIDPEIVREIIAKYRH